MLHTAVPAVVWPGMEGAREGDSQPRQKELSLAAGCPRTSQADLKCL